MLPLSVRTCLKDDLDLSHIAVALRKAAMIEHADTEGVSVFLIDSINYPQILFSWLSIHTN
jgi:hypothetical protein